MPDSSNTIDFILLNQAVKDMFNGYNLNPAALAFLKKQAQANHVLTPLEKLINSVQQGRPFMATIRRSINASAKFIPQLTLAANVVDGVKFSLGGAQILIDLIDIVTLITSKNKMKPRDIVKLIALFIGAVALGVSVFGPWGIFAAVITSAIRAVTTGMRNLFQLYENKQRLKKIDEELKILNNQMSVFLTTNVNNPDLASLLCLKRLALEGEKKRLQKLTKAPFRIHDAVFNAGNLAIIVGAALFFVPGLAPLGSLLILIGTIARAAISLIPTIAQVKQLKEANIFELGVVKIPEIKELQIEEPNSDQGPKKP